jgi:hypothetical protein
MRGFDDDTSSQSTAGGTGGVDLGQPHRGGGGGGRSGRQHQGRGGSVAHQSYPSHGTPQGGIPHQHHQQHEMGSPSGVVNGSSGMMNQSYSKLQIPEIPLDPNNQMNDSSVPPMTYVNTRSSGVAPLTIHGN